MASGEVMVWAALPGTGPHRPIDAEIAVKRAGLPTGTFAELVWRPSRASRSPLYPIWAVSAGVKTAYVDFQGNVWDSIESVGPGGG